MKLWKLWTAGWAESFKVWQGYWAVGWHGPIFWRFFYFLLSFFTKIYFRFGNLQKYTPAAGQPGLKRKKKEKKLQIGPWGRSPGSGAAGPPWPPGSGAAGPRPPYIRCLPRHPIWLTKNLEKRRGRERRGEREAKRRSPVGFSRRRL